MQLRINKLISDAGLGSRREVEEFIRRGRIKINGKRASLSDIVKLGDVVLFDDVDLPVDDLIREHVALEKILAKERANDNKPKRKGRAKERAESQRLQHASKSATLRKTSKNNPLNKLRAKQRAERMDELEGTEAPKKAPAYTPRRNRGQQPK